MIQNKLAWIAMLLILLTACNSSSITPTDLPTGSVPVIPDLSQEEQFSGDDNNAEYDTAKAIAVTLNGTAADCDSAAVSQNDGIITLSKAGIYTFSGEIADGQILVNAPKTEEIRLIFNGVTIHSKTSAPVYVKQAKKVWITLSADSQNTLSTGNSFVQTDDNTVDGVIFSKDDLTLNGQGSLTLTSTAGHGVVCKDDLIITDGNYTLSVAGHGFSANNSIRVADGTFTVTAGKDGLKAEHDTDTSLGYVYCESGHYQIQSGSDGISASGNLQIDGGSVSVTAGENTTDTTLSTKGIKAGGNVLIKGGTLSVTSRDDSLHSNENLAIQGGKLTLSTGDDGVHADGNVSVTAGTLTIQESYEGIEGQTIDISGGTVTANASDDGFNAAGGNDQSGFAGGMGADAFQADDSCYIHISGGKTVLNADGDGIDSNGSIAVSGGETYVYGPTNSGNGAIDAGGTVQATGGIFVATGTVGMAQNFDTSSTQGAALVSVNGSSNETLTLQDQTGNALVTCTPEKEYQCVVITCPDLQKGETYSLTAGSNGTAFTMNSLVEGSAGGMNHGGGMQPGGNMEQGGMGNQPGGNREPGGTRPTHDQQQGETANQTNGNTGRPDNGRQPDMR